MPRLATKLLKVSKLGPFASCQCPRFETPEPEHPIHAGKRLKKHNRNLAQSASLAIRLHSPMWPGMLRNAAEDCLSNLFLAGGKRMCLNVKAKSAADWIGCLIYLLIARDVLVHSSTRMAILLLPIALHEIIVAGSFLIRRPLNRKMSGWKPRVTAYIGTFLVFGFIRLSSSINPNWVRPTHTPALDTSGTIIWLIGLLFGLYSIWWFRHSFSIEPQARALVTSGPYRVARHPIYLSYLFQYIGILLTHLTLPLGLVMVVWCALMWKRIGYEESVLTAAFPEYALYRKQVSAIWPKIPRQVIVPQSGRSRLSSAA
jgi:protein-S-isoprenylcysteine O-methyltransferase Ste14